MKREARARDQKGTIDTGEGRAGKNLKTGMYRPSLPRPAEKPGSQVPLVEERTGQMPVGRLENKGRPPLNPLELVVNETKSAMNVWVVVSDGAVDG